MDFNYYEPNPPLDLELEEYETSWKGKKHDNGIGFFNNFFHKHLPFRKNHIRRDLVMLLNEDPSMTFGGYYADIYTGGINEDYKASRSGLLLSSTIFEFYSGIDSFLERKGYLHIINSFEGLDIWQFLRDNEPVASSCVNLYFDLRKQGYWRHKDLAA